MTPVLRVRVVMMKIKKETDNKKALKNIPRTRPNSMKPTLPTAAQPNSRPPTTCRMPNQQIRLKATVTMTATTNPNYQTHPVTAFHPLARGRNPTIKRTVTKMIAMRKMTAMKKRMINTTTTSPGIHDRITRTQRQRR